MITKEIKEVRCDDALHILMSCGRCVFFTLTTPDEVDYREIRERWRSLRHDLLREIRKNASHKIEYVMNFERHNPYLLKVANKDTDTEFILHSDGHCHGWHIHGVINSFVPMDKFLPLIHSHGFGRTDVRWVNSSGVAHYLTKHALKAYRGLSRRDRAKYGDGRYRLVNTSRGLPPLTSYRYESEHLRQIHKRMIEARSTEIEMREHGITPDKRPDYRIIRVYSELSYLLGLRTNYQALEYISNLQSELRKKERKEELLRRSL
jgi:hypothetical protein